MLAGIGEREELEEEGLVSTTPDPYAYFNLMRVDRSATLLA